MEPQIPLTLQYPHSPGLSPGKFSTTEKMSICLVILYLKSTALEVWHLTKVVFFTFFSMSINSLSKHKKSLGYWKLHSSWLVQHVREDQENSTKCLYLFSVHIILLLSTMSLLSSSLSFSAYLFLMERPRQFWRHRAHLPTRASQLEQTRCPWTRAKILFVLECIFLKFFLAHGPWDYGISGAN